LSNINRKGNFIEKGKAVTGEELFIRNYLLIYSKMIKNILRSKWILFTGLAALLTGILFRISIPENYMGLTLILTGVLLKTIYIIAKAQSGEYRPGSELLYLFIGLILFLSGIYLKNHNPPFKPLFLIVPGLGLKVLFIILFIRKTKKPHQI